MTKKSSSPVPLDDQLCYAIYSAGMAIQRTYKPLLDELGLTYPQYLVLNVLWEDGAQTVGGIAERLGLESSTLTPLLKRLEAAQLVTRSRNPDNERQVFIDLTPEGRKLESRAGCLGEALMQSCGQSPKELSDLNKKVRRLRDELYTSIGGWSLSRD